MSTRLSYQRVNTQDLLRLRTSLRHAMAIADLLDTPKYQALKQSAQILQPLETMLQENPPLLLKDGKTMNAGIHQELDELRDLVEHHQDKLLAYEQQERQRTDIKNLKVGYSRSFGYYLEVSKGQVDAVKDDYGYIRRQTLTNAQRYTTVELKELEVKLENASDQILRIEQELFDQLVEKLRPFVQPLYEIANLLAQIDVLCSFATISSLPGYVRPVFNTERKVHLRDSVHPILETTLKSHQVIANDIDVDSSSPIMILTGPNMGGKSTIMRQIAITSIMAQIGMYVRASAANLPLFWSHSYSYGS